VIRIAACAALVTSIAIAACSPSGGSVSPGPSGTPGASTSGSAAVSDAGSAEAVAVGAGLAQIRGHHAVSILLFESGDQQGALVHAGHPVAEILPALRGELSEHGVDPADLEDALRAAADAVDDKAAPSVVRDKFAAVAVLATAAERAVAGTAADADAYRASVIASLVSTAGREYAEAISNGAVVELIEYQDAFGFVQEARRLYGEIESAVRGQASHEADEIAEAFAVLNRALVAPQAPASPADPDAVVNAAATIGRELAEAVGARVESTVDAAEVVEEIGARLDEMVAAYRAGRVDAALDLAAEAYLEGYELIEADVIAHAPAINTELEPLLASRFRADMRAGVAPADLEVLVARAKELLADALTTIQSISH